MLRWRAKHSLNSTFGISEMKKNFLKNMESLDQNIL